MSIISTYRKLKNPRNGGVLWSKCWRKTVFQSLKIYQIQLNIAFCSLRKYLVDDVLNKNQILQYISDGNKGIFILF